MKPINKRQKKKSRIAFKSRRLIQTSVPRLRYFGKALLTNFLTKVAQTFSHFYPIGCFGVSNAHGPPSPNPTGDLHNSVVSNFWGFRGKSHILSKTDLASFGQLYFPTSGHTDCDLVVSFPLAKSIFKGRNEADSIILIGI